MTKNEYNGYTNYETWAVNLWLQNDQGLYNTIKEFVNDAKENSEASEYLTKEQETVYALENTIKEFIEESAPEVEGVWADLLNAALSEVNWKEIAENWLSE